MLVLQYLGVAEGVAAKDVEVVGAMEEEVHLGHGGVDHILLLAEDGAAALAVVLHVVHRLHEHAARAASGVIYRLAGLGVEDADKQRHDGTGSVELARLGFGEVGKLLEQHLVGVAHEVGVVVLVAQGAGAQMLYKAAQEVVAEHILVAPLGGGEHAQHAVERVGVGQLYLAHGVDDGAAEVLVAVAYVLPVAALGDDETVLLGEEGILHIALLETKQPLRLLQGVGSLLVEDVADAFEVEQGGDVFLEGILRDGAAEDVAGLKEIVVEFLGGAYLGHLLAFLGCSLSDLGRLSLIGFSKQICLYDSFCHDCLFNYQLSSINYRLYLSSHSLVAALKTKFLNKSSIIP